MKDSTLVKIRDALIALEAVFKVVIILLLPLGFGRAGLIVDAVLALPLLAWLFLLLAPVQFERFLLRFLPKQRTVTAEGRPEVITNHFDINQHNGLYLRRFYLSPFGWARKLFLHKICLSDTDRSPHDHQWAFWSFILKGKYREHIYHPNGCNCGELCRYRYTVREAPAGTLLRNKAEHTHAVEIVRTVWSLVFIGKKRREWGFWKMATTPDERDRWVRWNVYLNNEEPFDATEAVTPVERPQ